jgi:hypothetical protein
MAAIWKTMLYIMIAAFVLLLMGMESGAVAISDAFDTLFRPTPTDQTPRDRKKTEPSWIFSASRYSYAD